MILQQVHFEEIEAPHLLITCSIMCTFIKQKRSLIAASEFTYHVRICRLPILNIFVAPFSLERALWTISEN